MDESETNGWKRNEDGTFAVGNIGGGRTPETEEQKIIKKATKEIITEYKEALGEALPKIKPILIAKALEGDMTAIKEIHDRVMDKSKQPTDITSKGEQIGSVEGLDELNKKFDAFIGKQDTGISSD